jgi:PAS domain S-box-containing protein
MGGQTRALKLALEEVVQKNPLRIKAQGGAPKSLIDLGTILDNIADVVFIMSTTGYFVYVNQASEKRSGVPAEQLIGRHFLEIVDPRYQEMAHHRFEQAVEGQILPPLEVEFPTPSGKPMVVEVNMNGIYNDDALVAVLAISRDITDRKRTAEALQKAHEDLETKVNERTADLVRANELLQREIEERKNAESALKKNEKSLWVKTKELLEANTALRVLLKKREEDRTELEKNVLNNVNELVLPYLHEVRKGRLSEKQQWQIDMLESSLNHIISPFSRRLSGNYISLTPTERQVANLIKSGYKNKEIAEFLNLSPRTIEYHRNSIRKKLGLTHSGTNLHAYLATLE